MQANWRAILVSGAVALATISQALADEGCLDFKWDVAKERALFAGTHTSLKAGSDLKSAPAVLPERAYALKLTQQPQVTFVATPGRSPGGNATFAGLVTLKVPQTGEYRISIDMPFWIDVVSGATLLSPRDFQGQHACGAPHKIVEFDLTAASELVLQFSNGASDTVIVTVTSAPHRQL
jgi:hypothetical protein